METTVDYATGELLPAAPLGPLAAALAKAQSAFPTVTRSKTVKVKTKTGGEYTFAYAPLDVILDAVRKPLAENGLAVVQLLDREALVTLLIHDSGALLEARTPIPATADVQAFGSAITYLRRYAIQALLGIAAEEDDDGNSAAGNRAEPTKPARKPATASQGPAAPRQAATPSQTPGELTEDDWAGMVDTKDDTPASLGLGNGKPLEKLSARDFFARLEEAGIDRRAASDAARRMYGQDRWKITDLSDEQRAGLWQEIEPVPA